MMLGKGPGGTKENILAETCEREKKSQQEPAGKVKIKTFQREPPAKNRITKKTGSQERLQKRKVEQMRTQTYIGKNLKNR